MHVQQERLPNYCTTSPFGVQLFLNIDNHSGYCDLIKGCICIVLVESLKPRPEFFHSRLASSLESSLALKFFLRFYILTVCVLVSFRMTPKKFPHFHSNYVFFFFFQFLGYFLLTACSLIIYSLSFCKSSSKGQHFVQ